MIEVLMVAEKVYEEIDKNYLIKSAPGALVHYLEGIQKDLDSREGWHLL